MSYFPATDDTVDDLGPDIFDRLKGEPAKAYGYFQLFCEEGPGRKIKKLSEKVGLSTQYFYKLASTWQWSERAAAYDRAEDLAVHVEIRSQRVRLARQQLAVSAGLFHWAARYITKMTDERMTEFTPTEVSRWANTASTLARAALGEPDQRIAIGTGDEMGGFRPLSHMTETERRAELGQLLADIGKRFAAGEPVADEDALLALLASPVDGEVPA